MTTKPTSRKCMGRCRFYRSNHSYPRLASIPIAILLLVRSNLPNGLTAHFLTPYPRYSYTPEVAALSIPQFQGLHLSPLSGQIIAQIIYPRYGSVASTNAKSGETKGPYAGYCLGVASETKRWAMQRPWGWLHTFHGT